MGLTVHFQIRFLYPFRFTPRSILVLILDISFRRVQIECELLIGKAKEGARFERAGNVQGNQREQQRQVKGQLT